MQVATAGATVGMARDFRWFWTSQTLSFTGDRLTGFAVPSIAILALGASAAEVGALAAVGWLAYPALGLVAGGVLAHLPRRPVMIAGELIRFAAFVTIPLAALGGWVTTAQLFVVVGIAGAATVFVDIAGQSYLPALVDRQTLVGANSRLQSSDSLSKLAGPALAGAALKLAGPYVGLLLSAVPFLASAFGRTRIRAIEPPLELPVEAMPARIRRGLGFVWRHDLLRQLVGAAAVRSLGIGMVDAVLLLFAYRALGLSSLQGGLLIAAGSIGGLLGAFIANKLAGRLGMRRALLLTGLEGLCWLAIPLCLVAAPVIALVVIRICASVWMPMWNILTTSLRQAVTPPAMQSTVHATARTLTSATIPLGALLGGLAGDVLSRQLGTSAGLVVVLAVGGVLAGCSVVLVNQVSPAGDVQVADRVTEEVG
ncbi:MFS transporter [Kribbella sp. NBC_01245]|uniref:MFS transporter n=1 Tax=Kribbella sp. NBC_01245 TaxID=2903578 RepID=UPI002E2A9FCB|nr:MFS transporter [Kribbella sp. NBC_01245]